MDKETYEKVNAINRARSFLYFGSRVNATKQGLAKDKQIIDNALERLRLQLESLLRLIGGCDHKEVSGRKSLYCSYNQESKNINWCYLCEKWVKDDSST